jgi:tetratricopeptide (TPR) repeat protein
LAEEATFLNRRGQYDGVITQLEPYKGDKKNDSALFFNELGIAYRHKGRLSDAIQAYQAALSRDPENPVVMKNLGDAFFLNKEYPRAIEQFQKALLSNPRFQQAHSSLGLAYYQTQKYQEALEEFEIVLRLNPKDEQAQKIREIIIKKIKGQK